jgi:hypothetical protein
MEHQRPSPATIDDGTVSLIGADMRQVGPGNKKSRLALQGGH